MVKYTNTTLSKMQDLVKEGGYVLRYEKGSFKSGYCILQDKKVIIINKYFETEARINSLFEILPSLQLKQEELSENSRKFLEKINQKEIIFDEKAS